MYQFLTLVEEVHEDESQEEITRLYKCLDCDSSSSSSEDSDSSSEKKKKKKKGKKETSKKEKGGKAVDALMCQILKPGQRP